MSRDSGHALLLMLLGAVLVTSGAVVMVGYVGPLQILAGTFVGSTLGYSIASLFGCGGAGPE